MFEIRSGPPNGGQCQSNDQLFTQSAVVGRKADDGFAGEHKQGETPVPIPNTAVKPLLPMILLRGKVGHCRLHEPRQVRLAGLSFLSAQICGIRLKACSRCADVLEYEGRAFSRARLGLA